MVDDATPRVTGAGKSSALPQWASRVEGHTHGRPDGRAHRFDYAYDDRGNWTEKVGSVKIGENFTRFDIERREFTYCPS
jgi:hypothetical protein